MRSLPGLFAARKPHMLPAASRTGGRILNTYIGSRSKILYILHNDPLHFHSKVMKNHHRIDVWHILGLKL